MVKVFWGFQGLGFLGFRVFGFRIVFGDFTVYCFMVVLFDGVCVCVFCV